MRLDAPGLEKKLPVSTAILSDELAALDAWAASRAVTRSEAVRKLVVLSLEASHDLRAKVG
jgi:hypothetical protein